MDSCHFFCREHPTLDKIQKQNCDEIITIEEIYNSLKGLPNNKTPGLDGLPIEFYNFFWKTLKYILLDSFMYGFKNDILSLDQWRAVLVLLPKPNKDVRLLKNWRPISLLNTDYKIIAKLLSNRLQKVIPSIIHNDQVGYIKNRIISENIHTLLDTIELTNNKLDPGLLTFIDFEKAFDTISWKFLFDTLIYFFLLLLFYYW